MSTSMTPAGHRHDRVGALGAAAIVVLACLLLASRTWVAPLPPAAVPFAVLGTFTAILVASVLVPMARGRRRVPAGIALAVGGGALAGTALAAGEPAPLAVAGATLPMSLLAAAAEEALFRRVAYGHLERWGAPVAVLGSAILFALVHLPVYGAAVLPVDLGAGLVFGWQRWATGSWETPALTHAAANVVAMYR